MDTDHWASYYRSGALVSCPTNPEPYYTMEVREAWVRFFTGLMDGDRILDLGTGNGPVALIAKETAAENSCYFDIDAVDRADIDPHRYVPGGAHLLEGIRFHGGVDVEALPFQARQFNAVCGQYILEYTAMDETLSECARVMKPGGSCQFILHHANSIIVRNARESLRQAELIEETGTIRKFVEYCQRGTGETADAELARKAVYATGKILQARAKSSANPLLLRFVIDSISSLLARRSQLSYDEISAHTDELSNELQRWVQRLKDLSAAALSEDQMNALVNTAEANGFFAIVSGEQYQAGTKLVGWRLIMFRGS